MKECFWLQGMEIALQVGNREKSKIEGNHSGSSVFTRGLEQWFLLMDRRAV